MTSVPDPPLVALGDFAIPGLTGTRRVRAFVPPGRPPFPVLYLWDGQNAFGDVGSYAGGWHVHRVVERLARRRRRTAIVVAIDHGGDHRIADYSPWHTPRFGAGRADLLLDFVVGTLKPRVDRELPALTGLEQTIVGGSSMGGLLSLYAGLRHPGVFGRVLALSPTLWPGARALFDLVRESAVSTRARVYLDIGAREAGDRVVDQIERLADAFTARGLDARRLRFRVDPRGRHHEADWRRRLPEALSFLLKR